MYSAKISKSHSSVPIEPSCLIDFVQFKYFRNYDNARQNATIASGIGLQLISNPGCGQQWFVCTSFTPSGHERRAEKLDYFK
jgi:hypothetical protein